jgi:poly-D-alanine transfer protein DltD
MQQIPQQFRGKNGSNATAQTATMPQQKPQLQETVASNKQRKISPQVTWARKQGVNHPRKQQQQAENSAAGYLGSQARSKSSSQAAGGKFRRRLPGIARE